MTVQLKKGLLFACLLLAMAGGCKKKEDGSGGGGDTFAGGAPVSGANVGTGLPQGQPTINVQPQGTPTVVGSLTPVGTPTGATGVPVGSLDLTNKHVIFVTSERWDGNLGGIAGGDTKCQTAADNSKLGGTWKAVLSDKDFEANSRLLIRYPIKNIKMEDVAANRNALWDADNTPLLGAVKYNEFGMEPTKGPDADDKVAFTNAADQAVSLNFVWTGTEEDGDDDYVFAGSDLECAKWLSNAATDKGGMGRFDVTGEDWVDQDRNSGDNAAGSAFACSRKRHLYCLSQ